MDERSGLKAWLPLRLPPNVKIIVGATAGGKAAVELQSLLPAESFVDIADLDAKEADALVQSRLEQKKRRLTYVFLRCSWGKKRCLLLQPLTRDSAIPPALPNRVSSARF